MHLDLFEVNAWDFLRDKKIHIISSYTLMAQYDQTEAES